MENELYHYGRKGMKWYQNIFTKGKNSGGRKKGFKGKSKVDDKETVEQKKERVLKSRSAKELYENAHLFSDAELQKAYNRLSLERNVASLIPKEVDRGKQAVENAASWTRSLNDLSNNATGLYNNVAKVYNSFPELNKGNQIPLIKDEKKKDDK